MKPEKIRIVTRKSRLALLQVEEIISLLPAGITTELIPVSSWGDNHKEVSLLDHPPADIFTRELDRALLEDKADIAIHSAKDLPYPLPEGIEVIALTQGLTETDSLVSRDNLTLQTLPAGARVGTSSPTRRKELLKIRPDLSVVSIRGTIEERIHLIEEGIIDSLIVATCALERLGLTDKSAGVLPFQTHPLQGKLAITARENNRQIKEFFSFLDSRRTYGKVTLVGFGPGNPDLLTLAGQRALEEADIIYYDDLINKEYLTHFRKERVYVGKRSGKHSAGQEDINRLLLTSAREGKKVVRLKGGDPMIFAHGGEEVNYLESNFIPVQVIPGITTASALAASTGISLTYRGIASSVAFISGYGATPQTVNADTLVYYMGGKNNRQIAQQLIRAGRSPKTPVLLVHNVSGKDQQEFFSTLQELSDKERVFPTPLVILIGEVVKTRSTQLKKRNKLLYTGTTLPAGSNPEQYIHTPLVEIREVEDKSLLYESMGLLPQIDYLLFTSRYAVHYFFRALHESGKDSRNLHAIQIGAIGKVTAEELLKRGIVADICPEQEDSYGVVERFSKEKPGTILIPRSDLALDLIPSGLKKAGYTVHTVTAYRNTCPETIHTVELENISGIVFCSPSGVKRFRDLYGSFPEGKEYILKGAITRQAFHELQNTNAK